MCLSSNSSYVLIKSLLMNRLKIGICKQLLICTGKLWTTLVLANYFSGEQNVSSFQDRNKICYLKLVESNAERKCSLDFDKKF